MKKIIYNMIMIYFFIIIGLTAGFIAFFPIILYWLDNEPLWFLLLFITLPVAGAFAAYLVDVNNIDIIFEEYISKKLGL